MAVSGGGAAALRCASCATSASGWTEWRCRLWLKTTLVQCAWAASRKKASYLQAQFQRLRHRRGPKKAICAVAASILTAVYHMLRDGTFYQDLGANHFRHSSAQDQANRLVRQIANLGFRCSIMPATAAGAVVSV